LLGGVQAFGVIGLFVGPAVLALATSLFSVIREETHSQIDNPDLLSRTESEQWSAPGIGYKLHPANVCERQEPEFRGKKSEDRESL
jgi:hypothetical protein